jgi:hypothetical protein
VSCSEDVEKREMSANSWTEGRREGELCHIFRCVK